MGVSDVLMGEMTQRDDFYWRGKKCQSELV